MDKVFSPYNIKTGFRKCGVCPVDENAIDKGKLAPCDPEFSQPGPGGDNQSNSICRPDPLCETCGQFVRGHPLVTQGLIPAELADIFLPIIGTDFTTFNPGGSDGDGNGISASRRNLYMSDLCKAWDDR